MSSRRPPPRRGPGPGGSRRSGGRRRPGGDRRTGPATRSRAAGRSGRRGTTPVRAGAGGPKGLGGDQVEGRQAVRELLLAGRRRVREVLLATDLDPVPILHDIIDLADEHKVPISEVTRGRVDAVSRTESSQGVVALAEPLASVDLLALAGPTAAGAPPFLLLLDGITDPGNLGAVLRSAECAGVTGVVLPRHRSAHITPAVTKAAAGAVEHLDMALVGGIPAALRTLSEHDVWTVGLDAGGAASVHDLPVAGEAVALVLGAEGPGLSRLVRRRCDTVASIPISGAIESLNVAAAAAVACFEIARIRGRAAAT